MSDVSYVSYADLGGRSGFGRIVPEDEGVVFHEAWQRRVLALTIAMGATGSWNIDMGRSARETLPNYRNLSYYDIWLSALEKLLVERGLLTGDELATGRVSEEPKPLARVLRAEQLDSVLARGSPTLRAAAGPARFSCGARVRTRPTPGAYHTRLPAYLSGKTGLIERVHGAHVFPDSNAQGLGEDPQWLYTVVFDASEIWGTEAKPGHRVSFDAWQPYLEDP